MGTYTTNIGGCGITLLNKVTPLNIQLPANEYPTKIHFELKSGGSYWKNSNYTQQTGEFYLYSDENKSNAVKFGELTLPKISSNTNLKDFDVSGKSLLGCALYFDAVGGVGLRNVCQVTVTTDYGTNDDPPADPDLYKKLLPTVDQNDKMIGRARRAEWIVKVEGVDVTDVIAEGLISLEVTDNEENEADDLQIKVADRDGVWLQEWLNQTIRTGAKTKGLAFKTWIGSTDHTGKVIQQKNGTFYLDSIKHSGPPAQVTIKCTSCDFEGGIRSDENDKCWENVTLKAISADIAAKGKLNLLYCSKHNPKFERKEQTEETDIAFLIRIAEGEGLSIKVSDGNLIVFDRKSFESQEAIAVITYGDGSYTKWDLGTGNGSVTYDICTVSYTDPSTGKTIEGVYKSPAWQDEEDRVEEANKDKENDDDKEEPNHKELKIRNKKVTSIAQANNLAETELGLANLFERTATFTLPGSPALMAGLPIELKDFGYWTGMHMITTCTHTISTSGYTTKIKLRYIGKKGDRET